MAGLLIAGIGGIVASVGIALETDSNGRAGRRLSGQPLGAIGVVALFFGIKIFGLLI